MRYYGEEALGLVETIGMVPTLEACDKMLKAADVELISYENIGSTLKLYKEHRRLPPKVLLLPLKRKK